MPHFIIECSENIANQINSEETMLEMHDLAMSSGLFNEKDIKVRIKPYQSYLVAGLRDDFIHIFGNIMEGRTANQKNELSRSMVAHLKSIFPEVKVISMNIRDFKKDGYCNKTMV